SLTIRYTPQHGNTRTYTTNFEGVIPNLDRRYKETGSEGVGQEMEGYMSARICPDCHGAMLKPEVLAVTVGGHNIVQVTNLSIVNTQRFFQELEADAASLPTPSNVYALNGNGKKNGKGVTTAPVLADPLTPIDPDGPMVEVTLTERERFIGRQVLKEIRSRLDRKSVV